MWQSTAYFVPEARLHFTNYSCCFLSSKKKHRTLFKLIRLSEPRRIVRLCSFNSIQFFVVCKVAKKDLVTPLVLKNSWVVVQLGAWPAVLSDAESGKHHKGGDSIHWLTKQRVPIGSNAIANQEFHLLILAPNMISYIFLLETRQHGCQGLSLLQNVVNVRAEVKMR